jgi:predicted  nucleic acid-binding Zn-ribbon protein
MPIREELAFTVRESNEIRDKVTRTEIRVDYLEKIAESTNQHLCRIDDKLSSLPSLVQSINLLADRMKHQETNLRDQEKSITQSTTRGRIFQGLLISIFIGIFFLVIKAATGTI